MVFVDHILLDWIGDKYKMATQDIQNAVTSILV